MTLAELMNTIREKMRMHLGSRDNARMKVLELVADELRNMSYLEDLVRRSLGGETLDEEKFRACVHETFSHAVKLATVAGISAQTLLLNADSTPIMAPR